MKRVYKKRDEDAVSPVIATILMVAITVVLAAVLYVMVIGFGSGGSSTPAGAWNDVSAIDSTTAKLTFGQFTTDVNPLDLKLFVTPSGGSAFTIAFTAAPTTSNTTLNVVDAPGTEAAFYFDYSPAGNLINSGDYITIYGLSSGITYTVEVFHVDTEATVSMTGDSGTWSQP